MPKRNYWRGDEDKKAKPRNSDGLKRIVNNAIHLDITEDDNEVEIESEVGNRLIDLVIKVPVKTDVEAEVYAMANMLLAVLFYCGLRWEREMNTCFFISKIL